MKYIITLDQINKIIEVLDGVAKKEGFTLHTAQYILSEIVQPLASLPVEVEDESSSS